MSFGASNIPLRIRDHLCPTSMVASRLLIFTSNVPNAMKKSHRPRKEGFDTFESEVDQGPSYGVMTKLHVFG